MKLKILFIILVILVLSTKITAQNFEYGKVSVSELEEKTHPIDSAASAAIVYKKARTYFVYQTGHGFIANHENTIRIKIYKKEGLKWANFQTQYFIGNVYSAENTLKFTNCVTYNLENGKVVSTALQNEGNFKTNYNKDWIEASITMPNVKVGSVIEIKYISKSEVNLRLPVFSFQYDIPVNYAEYITDIPDFYVYKPILNGFVKVNTDIKLIDESKSYSYKYNRKSDLSFKYIQCIYKAENIPALKNEIYVDNISNYRASIQNELEKIRFPNEPVKDYSATWEAVARTIFDYSEFGKELNKQNYFEEDLKIILKNATTDREKVDSIFKFVQTKMNWNQENSIFSDKGVKEAYAKGVGNSAEINFILIAMLNGAKLQVDPVVISTVEHGIPVYPNRLVFNSVIAAVQIEGKQVLLDATSKISTTNTLPLEDLNWTGRLIKKDGSSQEINLVPEFQSKGNVNLMATIDNKAKVVGKVRIKKADYQASSFRANNTTINTESYLEKMESNLNGIQINDYSIDNVKDLSEPIIENFSFTSEHQFDVISNKIYVNPMLFFTQTKNPFVQEKRQMPIYFAYPKQDKFNIIIEIPEGYDVETLPTPLKITTPENVGLFIFNISRESNKIQIQVTVEINKAMISADFYDILKGFYQQIIDKQNEKIVLKKI